MAVIVRSMPASISVVTDSSISATVSGLVTGRATLSMPASTVAGASSGGTTPRTVASKSASIPAARRAASMASLDPSVAKRTRVTYRVFKQQPQSSTYMPLAE
jgi:hypothetical protein